MNDFSLQEHALSFVRALMFSHEKQIIEGLTHDCLFDLLSSEIEEARENFLKHPDIQNRGSAVHLFDKVLTDCLFSERNFISCPIW